MAWAQPSSDWVPGQAPGLRVRLASALSSPRLSAEGRTPSKMRRFLRPGHDPARERLKRDLFQFNKVRGLGDVFR